MKICPTCGSTNDDQSFCCAVCGATLPVTVQKKKSLPLVPILAVVGAVLLVAALVTGGLLLFGSPELKVAKAGLNTLNSFADLLQKDPALNRLIQQTQELTKKGDYYINMGFTLDDSMLYVNSNYSRGKKVMNGQLGYSNDAKDIAVEGMFSVDKKMVMFTPSMAAMNVYGFKIKDVAKKYESSILSALLPVSIPDDLGDLFFSDSSAARVMKSISTSSYQKFQKSISVDKLGKRDVNIGDTFQTCKVYQVSWDEKSLDALLSVSGKDTQLSKSVKELVKAIVPKLDPSCIAYVNAKGKIVGIDFTSVGMQYLLLLEGRENIWESFTLTKKMLNGTSRVFQGRITANANGMLMTLSDDTQTLLSVEHSNVTGDFNIQINSLGQIVKAKVLDDADGSGLAMNWNTPSAGRAEVFWKLGPMKETPKKLAKKYVDLFEMDLLDWQRFLLYLDITIPFG